MSNQNKLHIDLNQGIIDAEGDKEFVEKVYADFKDRVASAKPAHGQSSSNRVVERRNPQKRDSSGGEKRSTAKYVPKLDNALDTKKLASFVKSFVLKNHPEKILAFARFLHDELKIAPCSADQIFTCYRSLKQRVPEAFEQAFRDTRGSHHGYIDYKTLDAIDITLRGNNHFDDENGIKRKLPE